MKIEKIAKKLGELFDLSDEKQKKEKNQENLLKIIHKLKKNKNHLKEKLQHEGEINETSDKFLELSTEYKVASKLLKRAKKQYSSDQD